jgi:hypothetical protein
LDFDFFAMTELRSRVTLLATRYRDGKRSIMFNTGQAGAITCNLARIMDGVTARLTVG